MGFKAISIKDYVNLHLASNPDITKSEALERINRALNDFNTGVKCHCGRNIWVIGSAFLGNSCYTCITGEDYPSDNYEIDEALAKSDPVTNTDVNASLSDLFGDEEDDDADNEDYSFLTGGTYHNDDGTEIDPDLIPIPSMCLVCRHYTDIRQIVLCNLTRMDQSEDEEFTCYAYSPL